MATVRPANLRPIPSYERKNKPPQASEIYHPPKDQDKPTRSDMVKPAEPAPASAKVSKSVQQNDEFDYRDPYERNERSW